MATISSIFSCPTLTQLNSGSKSKISPPTHLKIPIFSNGFVLKIKTNVGTKIQLIRVSAVATEETASSTSSSESDRRVYIGNIPRNVNNDELRRIVEEHGAVEKAEVLISSSVSGSVFQFPYWICSVTELVFEAKNILMHH